MYTEDMFSRVHPFYHGLLAAIAFGLTLGTIISIGSHVDTIETSPVRCQDRVVALSVSNQCPKGTFLELTSDGNGGRFIICHCEQPMHVIIQMSPSQEQLEEKELPAPEVFPPRGSITL